MLYPCCESCGGRAMHNYWIPPEKRPPGTPEIVLVVCATCCGQGYVTKEEENDESPLRLPAL